MATISIDILRQEFPNISDENVAAHYANKYGHIVVLKYKSDPTKEYDKFASCDTDSEVEACFNSPNCHNVEIVYDHRPTTIFITQEMIIGKMCEICSKQTNQESLNLFSENIFFICGECTAMYCQECYLHLPLTEGDTGYGKCPKCDTPLSRAFPKTYAIPCGNSLKVIKPTQSYIEDFISKTLANPTFKKIKPKVDVPKGSLENQLIKASNALKGGKKIDKVKRLIAEGADINARYGSKTALMYASINGHLDIAKVLLNNGAEVNLEDWDGRTALMFASQNGHKGIVIELLKRGADLLKKDIHGETALIMASRWGREEIVSLIKERTGKNRKHWLIERLWRLLKAK